MNNLVSEYQNAIISDRDEAFEDEDEEETNTYGGLRMLECTLALFSALV